MLLRSVQALIGGAALVLFQGEALAVDFSAADENPSGWNFRFTPYAWSIGISGSATVRGNTANLNASIFDLINKSDELIPAMGYFEANRGPVSLFTDLFYSKLGFSKSSMVERNPIAGLTLTAKGRANLTQQLFITEFGAGYQVAEAPGAFGTTALDIIGAGRYWNSSTDLNLKINGKVDLSGTGLQKQGKYAVASSGDVEWIDPVVGFRVRQEMAHGQELQLEADIGGFGVGSQFSWQLFAGYSHEFKVGDWNMAWLVAYRALSVDKLSGSGKNAREVNLVLHGPLAGLSFRW